MSETVQENVYEVRPLVASDMGAICKIISAIGIREFKECFKVDDLKAAKDGNADVEKIGIGVLLDAGGIIISNIPKAEGDIQAFVASVTGLNVSEVKTMPFADYGELIIKIVTNEDFKDFFSRVMKLFNR